MPNVRQALSTPADRLVEFIDTQFLPTTETTIISGDVDIVAITISNHGGQANPKFSIKDKQGTPLTFEWGINTAVPAGAASSWGPDPGRRATGGLTWVCDTASALVGHIRYRRP